jgi:hypothetical protein
MAQAPSRSTSSTRAWTSDSRARGRPRYRPVPCPSTSPADPRSDAARVRRGNGSASPRRDVPRPHHLAAAMVGHQRQVNSTPLSQAPTSCRSLLLELDRGAVQPCGRPVSPARSPNRTCGFHRIRLSMSPMVNLSVAHRCNLVWIPSTRARLVETGPRRVGVHQRPPGIPCSLLLARWALRHVAGFPGLGLLRALRPTTTPSADSGPAPEGRSGGGSHVHIASVDGTGTQFFPLQHRHAYAADLRHGLATGCISPASESPTARASAPPTCAAPRLTSARFEPVSTLEGVQPLVHSRCASPSC